jgi:hypothetical protein
VPTTQTVPEQVRGSSTATARRRPIRLPERFAASADPAPASGRFPWLVTLASAWILVGLFLDGYFHIHEPEGESFFTPWHGVLYSGVGVAVAVHLLEQRRAGGVRPGYGLSGLAGPVVLAAGFVDMVWHTVLGVEADLDALLSPPHLLLILAGTMVFAGPLRAALSRPSAGAGLPAAFSAAFVVTGLGFFTQYANPFTHLYPVRGYHGDHADVAAGAASHELVELRQVAGVAGVVLFAALVGGAVAVLRRLEPVPPGAVLVAVAVPAVFLTTLRSTLLLVPAVVLAAVLTELAARRLGAAATAGLAAALLTTSWVLTLALTRDLAWSLELLTGAIGSAAAAGYLAGWLVQAGARRPYGAPTQV